MQHQPPKFQEEFSAKIPALTLLCNLGWQFITPEQALQARYGRNSEVVLLKVLREELQKRRFMFTGKEYPLSEKAIDSIVHEMCSPALNEGLKVANEKIYNHLLYGISVTEFVNGKKANPTIALIDWKNINNNSFLFTEEFSVLRHQSTAERRPDIVCFVNGLPLVMIEAKRPNGKKEPSIEAGISQHLRNQRSDEIPKLFAYSQILLAINGVDGRYGTQGTEAKYWALWRDEEFTEQAFRELKNKRLSDEQLQKLFSYRSKEIADWYQRLLANGELAVTDQDRLIISLLSWQRLLEIMRLFIVFDKKKGKIIARYQQVFGVKKVLQQVAQKNSKGARAGGVVWHTTGTGKSLEMILLTKALIFHESLSQCRIIVITDRVDLENQLSLEFLNTGGLESKKDKIDAIATSGTRLATQIGKSNERIIFSLIQKFTTAVKQAECYNDSSDIIVLIDEAHRTQDGENHSRMRQALPNAGFIAYTGTPLLKNDKTTNKFGPIIHAYTMQQGVSDKVITPLLYEERKPILDINEQALDAWFNRITVGLTEQQKADLKKKFANKGQIYQAEDRIHLIALDIANHFYKNFIQFDDKGLKAQLACESKLAAVKYKKFIDATGLFEAALVMSPPDTREGNTSVDESTIPEVVKWWKDNVGHQDEPAYTKAVIARFENDPELRLLIVVDKLLTGFNEEKNSVLYIDKPLKAHNLIQAVARVNRLHPAKEFGLLIDYRGILGELDTTIAKYQDLASQTQAGFDIADLEGLYQQVSMEYKKLPRLYSALWSIFKDVKNKSDPEQLRQALIPRMQEIEGEWVDINLKRRDEFYVCLSEFNSCLQVALQSVAYFEDRCFTEQDREHYKETVKQFISLRATIQADCNKTIRYKKYEQQISELVDKQVVALEVQESSGVYEVSKMGRHPKAYEWSTEKARNESDLIRTQLTRMIEQDLEDDPYAKQVFSKLLRQVIKEVEALFDQPIKQYLLWESFKQKVAARQLDDMPKEFNNNLHAQAYYGLFKITWPDMFSNMTEPEQKRWIELAFNFDKQVTNAIAEHFINPQNIEAEIRKKLLPLLWEECKKIGSDMKPAKKIIESIIQITRVGLNNS